MITDFEAHILYDTVDGAKSELKEWYAIVQYLQSFDKVDEVAQVSSYYQQTRGRKIIENDHNMMALLRNPNQISLTVYIAVPAIIILIVTILITQVRRCKRKKARKRPS